MLHYLPAFSKITETVWIVKFQKSKMQNSGLRLIRLFDSDAMKKNGINFKSCTWCIKSCCDEVASNTNAQGKQTITGVLLKWLAVASAQASLKLSSNSRQFPHFCLKNGAHEGNEGDEGNESHEEHEVDEEGRWRGGASYEGNEGNEGDEGDEGDEGNESHESNEGHEVIGSLMMAMLASFGSFDAPKWHNSTNTGRILFRSVGPEMYRNAQTDSVPSVPENKVWWASRCWCMLCSLAFSEWTNPIRASHNLPNNYRTLQKY